MNLEYFIAKRFYYDKSCNKQMSRPAVKIAVAGVATGLAIMILAVSIILGFKREIREKVIGFGSHVQISNFDGNGTYETYPIKVDKKFASEIAEIAKVKHVQRIVTKPAIIKTEKDFQGIVIKGIGSDFNWDFFKKNLIKGDCLQLADSTLSKGVLISENLANMLSLDIGDDFLCYFLQDQIRARKFVVSGIFNTNISEYDKLFVLADMQHLQKLNKWNSDQISSIEVIAEDFDCIEDVQFSIFSKIANRFDENGTTYQIKTIQQISPHIFGWLDMLDINAWVILFLMLAVAGFNIVSGLLILILEKTSTIGLLKAIGANDWTIRKIFIFQSTFLIGKGMFWGNVIGVLLCLLQHFSHLIPLDPSAYYVSTVPISLDVLAWLLLNIATASIAFIILIIPSVVISKISPAQTIRFE
ncbi:MAG: ABC transporter permease [Paludibacteraceae bacterium]|nr:ABC transporter permease [Paludibacteraceae bacterium]